MSPATRLAALIVNYDSGAFAVRCAQSLRRGWAAAGRPAEALELVVVDNASPTDQGASLARLEAEGARVIRSDVNLGYAGGVNRAFAATSGGRDDVVAILNPDVCFPPGSVDGLVRFVVEHPEVGVVDPRATIDPLGVLNLPRNLLPTLGEELALSLASVSPALCRRYSARRLRHALPWLEAEGPLESDMLSGCCLFLRRGLAHELDPLLDDRFPLYYEDADLFRRVRARGLKLIHHGGVRVVHHWARSTGIGALAAPETVRRHEVSRRAYYEKYYGGVGVGFCTAVHGLVERWPAAERHRPMHALEELGAFSEPVVIELPRACRFLLELAIAPDWLLAVGIVGEGRRWVCPGPTWEWFFQAPYFLRGLDRDTGELLGAWSFHKTTPGRSTPLELDELGAEVA